jgi:hypothetical protein
VPTVVSVKVASSGDGGSSSRSRHNDFGNESSKEMIQLVFTQPSQKEPIFVNAGKVGICEVTSILLDNAIDCRNNSNTRATKRHLNVLDNLSKKFGFNE